MLNLQALSVLKKKELEFGGFGGEIGRLITDRSFQFQTLKDKQPIQ
jgi:hypothetical protein